MTAQHFVILARHNASADPLPPIGGRAEILHTLAHLNTMPERNGDDVLYGPGICIELPPQTDPVNQMLLSITEEEIAWHVIRRIVARLGCKLLDPSSGRELNA